MFVENARRDQGYLVSQLKINVILFIYPVFIDLFKLIYTIIELTIKIITSGTYSTSI